MSRCTSPNVLKEAWLEANVAKWKFPTRASLLLLTTWIAKEASDLTRNTWIFLRERFSPSRLIFFLLEGNPHAAHMGDHFSPVFVVRVERIYIGALQSFFWDTTLQRVMQ